MSAGAAGTPSSIGVRTAIDEALPAGPDIVLLDNMTPDRLREAVARRDAAGADVELEASGGVNLQTIAAIASSGVDRISVGALTHSAVNLDVGLDWLAEKKGTCYFSKRED